ncbi:MAG: hypothetical protein AB2421_06495 [Thermotaleaceae bacterium]
MASKSTFFGKFLAFFLILIIIGGVGFLGYNLLSGSMGGMEMDMANSSSDTKLDGNSSSETTSKADNSMQDQMSMNESSSNNSSNQDQMVMNENQSDESMNMGESSETNTQYSTPVITAVLQNKDDLEKTLVRLKESIKLMTQDPFEEETVNNSSTASVTEEQGTQSDTTENQGNTVVNVFPQGTTPSSLMGSMGATYDATKMEQLHTGIYKATVGLQLLEQLKGNLSTQLEQASTKITNPSQYLNNQYLYTVQNKNKLNEALTYINEASSLVNINPYVSQNGLVYNQDKMNQIHDSIDKFAVSVIELNKINDNFSRQTIEITNLAQNSTSMSGMNMNMNMGGFFSNINMTTVFNFLVIVFIVIFIVSIFGYMSKLLKSSKKAS